MKARPKRPPIASSTRMRRGWWVGLAIGILFAALASLFLQRPHARDLPPAPAHYLDDQAGLLSPAFAAAKDQYIQHLSRTMRIAQINVVILPTVRDGDVEGFTMRAASAWKGGRAAWTTGYCCSSFAIHACCGWRWVMDWSRS